MHATLVLMDAAPDPCEWRANPQRSHNEPGRIWVSICFYGARSGFQVASWHCCPVKTRNSQRQNDVKGTSARYAAR